MPESDHAAPMPPGRGGTGAEAPESGATAEASAVVDGDGFIRWYTEDAERLLGFSAKDVVDGPALRLLSTRSRPDTFSRVVREWTERARGRKRWSHTVLVRHRDGRVLRLLLEWTPLSNAGDSTYWLVLATRVPDGDMLPNDSAVLRLLLDNSPVALSVWGPDLRCIWLNNFTGDGARYAADLRAGASVAEALPGFDTDMIRKTLDQVLKDGGAVIDRVFHWTSADKRTEHAFSLSAFRLEESDGRPLGVCVVAMDIEDSSARKRAALLSEAGRRIGTTLDMETTAQELADSTVPQLADYVTVDLAESVRLDEEPLERLQATQSSVPAFRRAGVASVREDRPESAFERGEVVFVPPDAPFADVLERGEPHFEPVLDTSPGTWLDKDPVRARIIRQTGMHSLMIVPLEARGDVLGIAVFVRTVNTTPFSKDDFSLAQELVSQAALNVDNAYRYTLERTTALSLQRNLLPRSVSGGYAVDVATRYLPTDTHAGVGGDWFDVIPLPGARVALMAGDVVGHGIEAASTMGRLRSAANTLADLDLPPHQLLAHLDAVVSRLGQGGERTAGRSAPIMAATCVCAVYDPVTRTCTVARAGHPPPAVMTPTGEVGFLDTPAGAPVGMALSDYESVEFTLEAGSTIALYTDGLVERRDADLDVGLERLRSALAQPSDDLEELCSAVIGAMLPSGPSHDDTALLLARTRELGSHQLATWDFAADPVVVAQARDLAVDTLRDWDFGSLSDNVAAIVSELVTNAVKYGGPLIRLRLIRHTTLVLEVTDEGTVTPHVRQPADDEEGGRGLRVVSKLARRWGSRFTPAGKVTWAELDLPA